jgi:hypothetical protein
MGVFSYYCENCEECLHESCFPQCLNCFGDRDDRLREICEQCGDQNNFIDAGNDEKIYICNNCFGDKLLLENFDFYHLKQYTGITKSKFIKQIELKQKRDFTIPKQIEKLEKEILQYKKQIEKINSYIENKNDDIKKLKESLL